MLVPGTMAKSPVTAVLLMARGRPPLLVRVTMGERAAMPTPVAGKLMAEVGREGDAGGATPVPVSEMVWVRYWSEMVRVPVAGADACGLKGDADGAGGVGVERVAAGVDDAEVAGGDLGGDQSEGYVAGVCHRDGLRRAGGGELLWAEGEGEGRERVGGGRGSGAAERGGLGACVVGDGEGAGAGAGGGGGEGDGDGAAGAGCER